MLDRRRQRLRVEGPILRTIASDFRHRLDAHCGDHVGRYLHHRRVADAAHPHDRLAGRFQHRFRAEESRVIAADVIHELPLFRGDLRAGERRIQKRRAARLRTHFAASRVASGPIVAEQMMTCSGVSRSRIESSTSSSACPSATKSWIISHASATSAAEPRKFGTARGVRFHTETWKPAARSPAAARVPMMPSPMIPTFFRDFRRMGWES